MFTSAQDFAAFNQTNLDKVVRLSSIVLSGAERMASLQLELSRKLLADNAQAVKSLSELKDPKALAEFQSSQAQPAIDQSLSVARNLYDAAVQTQNELTAFFEDQVAESNQVVLVSLDKLTKNAPAGTDVAVNALKTMISTSSAAFDNVSKTAKKMGSDFAEASVEAAASTAKATSAAAERKKPVVAG
ncbi:phasin family protein [Craterilacuibacter sp.]|uniref:phasin family protein n=1 Tax=Craterilacuibacter sp. TaxID=2870909 RepID=UPI003F2DAA90